MRRRARSGWLRGSVMAADLRRRFALLRRAVNLQRFACRRLC
jgi:hypothetical protein